MRKEPPNEAKPPEEERGLVCTRCGCRHFWVVYTRPASRQRIMRMRECRNCGRRVPTYEEAC